MWIIKYLVLIGILAIHFFISSCSNLIETSITEWEVENDSFVSDLLISDIDLTVVDDSLYVAVASRVDGIVANGVVTQYKLTDFGWEVEGDSGFTAGNSTELNQFYWENELYVSGVQGTVSSGTPFLYTYDGFNWEDNIGSGVSSEIISGATFLTYNGTLYSVYRYSNDLFIKSQNATFGDWTFIQDDPFQDDPIVDYVSEFHVNINSVADSTTSSIWVAYRDEDVNGELSVSLFDLEGDSDNQELIGEQGFSDEGITSPYLTWVNEVLTVSYLNESSGLEIWQHVDSEWERYNDETAITGPITSYQLVSHNDIFYVAYKMTSDENKLVVVIYDDDEWDVVGDVTVSEGTRSGTGLVVGAGTETSGTVSAFDMVVTDDYIYVGYGDVDAGGKAIVKTFER